VVLDGETLGKPRDRAHADALLQRLSARSHDVLTAVALAEQRNQRATEQEPCMVPLDQRA